MVIKSTLFRYISFKPIGIATLSSRPMLGLKWLFSSVFNTKYLCAFLSPPLHAGNMTHTAYPPWIFQGIIFGDCQNYDTSHYAVWIKKPTRCPFCILYFSSNSCSTCFGQPCALHQELTTAWCYSLVLVCAVAAGRLSRPVGR